MLLRTSPRIAFALVAAIACATNAQADPKNMCVPAVGGLGGIPTIDGVVNDDPGALNTDPGWNGATRINLGEIKGSTPTAVMEAGTNGAFLYLAFVVSTPLVSPNNTIVLGFSPQDANSAHDWRIHMKVFGVAVDTSPATDFTNLPPNSVTYWRDSNTWNAGGAGTTATAGTWLIGNVRVAKKGSQWSVEMKVPMILAAAAGGDTGVFFPASPSTFRMYVDVLSTISAPTPTVDQTPWPFDQPICAGTNPCPVNNFLTNNTPPITPNWGIVSLFSRPPVCAGVTLAWNDIGVLDPNVAVNPPIISNMRRAPGPFGAATVNDCTGLSGTGGPTNTFIARPLNNGTAGAQVQATFRIANWGIPGALQFDPLPPPGTSTSIIRTIDPGSGASNRDLTATWALTFEQSCKFSFFPHQCIHVDLDSPDLSVTFERKSVERNMDFVPASTFKRKAYVNGDQGPLPPGATKHRFLIAVETDQQGLVQTDGSGSGSGRGDDRDHGQRTFRNFRRADLMSVVPKQANTSFASWIARGLVYTGNRLRFNDTDFQIVDDVGDFGYVASHDEAVTNWLFRFTGARLQRLTDELYLLEVAPGQEEVVETLISANEGALPGAWRFFVDLGGNLPTGSFDNVADGQLSVNAGFERFVATNWSLEGIVGYHGFKGAAGSDDPKLWQFALNVKGYFGPGPWHFFVNAGGGVYLVDPGSSTEAGWNLGGGILYDVDSRWGIEGAYNYHLVNGTPDERFSTFQAGVRIRF